MVSCKKLSGSASRSLCLLLLHHVRLSEKNIAISRILREVFFPSAKDEAGSSPPPPPSKRIPQMFFCLRRKTRCLTWSSCLHEQSAQEHINESSTFVTPVSLDLNRLTWTSDTTFFPRSSQPTMNKAPVQPPTACKAYPMQ